MKKTSSLDIGGGLLLPEGVKHNRSPKITGVKPVASQVYIELLTQQELANTDITIAGDEGPTKTPEQGYIIDVGPSFKAEDWGFGKGDRVMISGIGIMTPNFDNNHRKRFLLEPSSVKCVLEEEK
ncbi:MAG: hypothetical protein EKK64_00400 [Neisseriaceae bacterium]|nr:MAG: hypothetical protein EKK64_00400 [Neisseriaceae bacterium]